MKIRIFGIAPESIVDGKGIRLAIFVQGCCHSCEGCHNPESHPLDGGKLYDTAEIITMMENPLLDGITLSGGEPLLQAEACRELAAVAHSKGLNVWCYTGFTYEQIRDGAVDDKGLLDHVDVLVDGRFEIEKRSLDLLFRGSLNQRLIDVKSTRKTGNICIVSP